MAQQVITISLNANDFASKVNANFSELFNEFGSGLTRQIVSKDENAGTFISKCNTNFSNLFTAASPSQSRTTLTDSMSANQVVNALNTNFDILYGTESGGGGEVVTDDKLKVLFFGNSYTMNSVGYLPFVLQNLDANLKFKITFFFAANSNLNDYYNWWNTTGLTTYTFNSETDFDSGGWKVVNQVKPKVAVESDDWDLIVLQQSSEYCFVPNSYGNVGNLLSLIATSMSGKTYKVGWNVNHTRNQVAYNYPLQALNTIQSVCQQNHIDVILPYGTAIFNALTKAVCREYHTVPNVNLNFKLQDNSHLAPGLPMYIASLAIAQALSDEFDLGLLIENDNTEVSADWSDENKEGYMNVKPYTQIFFLPVTDGTNGTTDFRSIAKRAARAAISNNFLVTQLDGETLSVTYNLTGCHIVGTAPTTGINYGETISFRIVADEGKTMGAVTFSRWGSPYSVTLGENGEFEKVVVEDLVITATAT